MKFYLILLLSLFLSVFSWATMIGDTITINRYYPSIGVHYVSPISTVVQAGTADSILSQSHILFNFEANHIYMDFQNSTGYAGSSSTFDGYRLTGFSNTITNVTLQELTQMGIYALGFGANYIDINLTGSCNSNSFIALEVQFQTAVPECSSFVLLILAFLATKGLRNNRRKI